MRSSVRAGLISLIGSAAMVVQPALATEGYFQHGYGARHKAMAGSGTADPKDATILAINPAGLSDVEHELQGAISIFAPDRGFTGTGGPGFTPNGSFDGNESEYFLIPNFAYAVPVSEAGTLGLSLHGNGGMNTDYAAISNPACASAPFPAPNGVFCGGEAGVNLNQLFVAVGYSHEFETVSLGISPIIGIQMFEGKGVAAFGGISSDPLNLTNNGTDYAYGIGLRLGALWDVTDTFRLGASYQTEIDMSEFDDYAGLFADAGDFDVPQTFNVGLAFDATDKLTVALDYRWMAYSEIGSVGNATTLPVPLGASGGAGFGWSDVEAWKFGIEYVATDRWTLRAGYAHNDNPIGPEDVTLNILAPGVVTDHFTAGFEHKLSDRHAVELAVMYAPEEKVTGIEVTPQGPNPGHFIELGMDQFELTVGWSYQFGK